MKFIFILSFSFFTSASHQIEASDRYPLTRCFEFGGSPCPTQGQFSPINKQSYIGIMCGIGSLTVNQCRFHKMTGGVFFHKNRIRKRHFQPDRNNFYPRRDNRVFNSNRDTSRRNQYINDNGSIGGEVYLRNNYATQAQ